MQPSQLGADWKHLPVFSPEHTSRLVESFFVKVNDLEGRRSLWVRLTLFASGGERYAETWAIWFEPGRGGPLALKTRHAIDRVRIDSERPGLGIAHCELTDGHTVGVIDGKAAGDSLVIAWDLQLDDELPPYHHFPAEWLYRSGLIGSKIVSPKPCAAVRGHIDLWQGDGAARVHRRIDATGFRGMHGHNWGKKNAEKYAWAHCNAFAEVPSHAYFEGFSAQVRIGGMLTPPISLARLVLGERQFRFDRFRNFTGQTSEVSPTAWRFVLQGPEGELRGQLRGEAAQTAGLHYANPKGPTTYCLNSKLARLELELRPKAGPIEKLTSEHAALEVAQHDPNHGIVMLV